MLSSLIYLPINLSVKLGLVCTILIKISSIWADYVKYIDLASMIENQCIYAYAKTIYADLAICLADLAIFVSIYLSIDRTIPLSF